MKNFFRIIWNILLYILNPICVIILVVILFLLPVLDLFNLCWFDWCKLFDDRSSMHILHDFSLILLTVIIASIAWIQLRGIHDVRKADFLFRIDERYGQEPIIKARQIIQWLYRESVNALPDRSEVIYRNKIAKKIDDLSRDVNRSDEYIYILNLLDFLETISYLANTGKISREDVNNLMGPSMEFFFEIFKPRIEDRRKKYKNDEYYAAFEKFVTKQRKK